MAIDWTTVWITIIVTCIVILLLVGVWLSFQRFMAKRKKKKDVKQPEKKTQAEELSNIFSKKEFEKDLAEDVDVKERVQQTEPDTLIAPTKPVQTTVTVGTTHNPFRKNKQLLNEYIGNTGLHTFDYSKDPRLSWREKRALKKLIAKELSTMVHVTMYLNNGMVRFFVIAEEDDGFMFKGGKYVLDSESKRFSPDLQMWCYEFQEKFALPITQRTNIQEDVAQFIDDVDKGLKKHNKFPIDKTFKLQELKDSVEESGLTEIETAVNPVALKRFIDTNVILQVLGGAWFTKVIRILLIVLVIVLVLVIITMMASVYNTGVLDNINLGGG